MTICFIVSWSNKSNCLKYEKYRDMDYMHLVVGGQSWEKGIRIVLKYPITKCIVLGKIHDAMPGCLQAGWCLHTHTLYSSDLTN